MNKADAKKVVRILFTADGGCQCCVGEQLSLFAAQWPEHISIIETVWEEEEWAETYGKTWTEWADWEEAI